MKKRARVAPMVPLLVFASLAANGQSASETLVGQRLRLTTREGAGRASRIVGTLVSTDEAGLTLAASGAQDGRLKVPHDAIARAELSLRKSRKGRWAVIGGATGALVGGVVGYLSVAECSRGEFLCIFPKEDRGKHTVGGALILGAGGAALGALFGPGEKWQDARPERLRVSFAPLPHRGARVAVTLGF
jgi:hypothetical protein